MAPYSPQLALALRHGPLLLMAAMCGWQTAGSVVGTYAVGSNPEGIAFDGAHIWVTNRGDGTVTELADSGGRVVANYPTGAGAGGQPIGIAYDGKYMWIANSAAGTVAVLSDASGALIGKVPGFYIPSSVPFDSSNIWVGDWGAGAASKL